MKIALADFQVSIPVSAPKRDQLIKSLIGVPFVYGGRSPEQGFDCYGLMSHLLREVHGQEIPDFQRPEHRMTIISLFMGNLNLWEECDADDEGACVLIRLPKTRHCGYCLGNDMFCHVWEQSNGVCIERLSYWSDKIMGYYKYVG